MGWAMSMFKAMLGRFIHDLFCCEPSRKEVRLGIGGIDKQLNSLFKNLKLLSFPS